MEFFHFGLDLAIGLGLMAFFSLIFKAIDDFASLPGFSCPKTPKVNLKKGLSRALLSVFWVSMVRSLARWVVESLDKPVNRKPTLAHTYRNLE
jgi:hypothetical protein